MSRRRFRKARGSRRDHGGGRVRRGRGLRAWRRRGGSRRVRPVFGWRWRRNPLRRPTDLVEAWLGVVTVLLFCAVPAAGYWAGHSVDRVLQRVARTQRSERTLVPAVVVDPHTGKPATGGAAAGTADPRHGDLLRWTAPDHSVHTVTVSADTEVWRPGGLGVWTDKKGHLVPPPLDGPTAATHAALAGFVTGAATGGLLLVSRQLVMWRLMRRRLAGWEREWARVGQDWGRAGTGG